MLSDSSLLKIMSTEIDRHATSVKSHETIIHGTDRNSSILIRLTPAILAVFGLSIVIVVDRYRVIVMKRFYGLSALILAIGVVGLGSHLLAQSSSSSTSQASAPPTLVQATDESPHIAQVTDEVSVGGLYVQGEESEQQVFPLRHTDVQAQVSGNVARVEVTQTFENPFDDPLEAIYVFPLPDEAAVDDMEITLGDRTIRGEIKPREEAQEIYEQAVQEGRTAGLLEQERANIFTQSLANIRPGEQIEVTIRYTESLQFDGGDYEFVFPMVVGPRYIPGTPISPEGDTNQVPDASRITPPVLRPGTRSGHDINVTVQIDAGVPIQNVRSLSHDILVSDGGNTTQVSIANTDTIPNRDLILRYQVSGNETQTTVLTQENEQGGHFAVYLIPALEYDLAEIVPKDVVFLIDTSGSQSGDPIAKSQELMRRMINGLNPDDTFTIIDFSNTTQQLSATPLENTSANRQRAIAYVNQLTANGGTELLNGIQTVMNYPPATDGRLRSIVLLTDGYIGNDFEILAEVQENLEPGNRLYSFGVGSGVNRFLLDRLAEIGRGTLQVIRHDQPSEEVAEQFFQQINNPVLTNIDVTWEGNGTDPDIYPLAPPDLFSSQPLVIFGRQPEGNNGRLRITGTAAGGRAFEQVVEINFDEGNNNPAIAQLWGRARIKDLMNQMYSGETTTGVAAVTETSLNYRLLSQYTAFVAVSEEVRVDPDGTRRTVEVPVELPEGVSYDGIFGVGDDVDLTAGFPGGNQAGGSRGGGSGAIQNVAPAPALLAPPPSLADSEVLESREIIPYEEPEDREPQIVAIAADGLDDETLENLNEQLLYTYLPAGYSGEVIMEIRIQNGRVEQILLDDQVSTLQDREIVNILRQQLQYWNPPETLDDTLRITFQIES